MITLILQIFSLILPTLIAVAFFTLVERKVLAAVQRRIGPNEVGLIGLLQPFADAAKLLLKETIFPGPANRWLFILAPIITLILSILSWAVIPTFKSGTISDLNLGIFYIFSLASLGVYGIIIARLV